jgi:hypothetical protein
MISLHPIRVRAALRGSARASVEIVPESFLHNGRLPLPASLTATLGICLAVAGLRTWRKI